MTFELTKLAEVTLGGVSGGSARSTGNARTTPSLAAVGIVRDGVRGLSLIVLCDDIITYLHMCPALQVLQLTCLVEELV